MSDGMLPFRIEIAAGWAMGRTARAWAELMRRLGYERYGVHVGDVGAGVSGMVAGLDGEHVIGVHVVTDPLTAAATATFLPGMAGRLDENDPVDKLILGRMDAFKKEGSGYLSIQNSRPQTIGYGLVDSPLLQLASNAEKVHEWTDLPVDSPAGAHWTEFQRGKHFPAMEAPAQLAADLQAFFGPLQ
jgi:hypothetical protein